MQSVTGREAEVFRQALRALNESQIPYVIGGAFAVHHYGGTFRDTNDLDVFVQRRHVAAVIDTLTQLGFRDIGEMAAGDRGWIFHAMRDECMVDVIWQAPNGIATVSESQCSRGSEGVFLETPTRFMPADDLIVTKIFTMNLHRCDWPDVLRIVLQCPEGMDWWHIIEMLGEHWPVLLSFIILFDWVYPNEACCVPADVRGELLRRKLECPTPGGEATREIMLDPWIYTRPVAA